VFAVAVLAYFSQNGPDVLAPPRFLILAVDGVGFIELVDSVAEDRPRNTDRRF
jgi:hypothetical protein